MGGNGNGIVSGDQGNAMGGANNPAGAQADNTFQSKNVKQLVMLVRYKPAPVAGELGDMSAATSMVSSVTGAVEGAVNDLESAMASVAGFDMFIKEKPTASTSEKEYTWDYSAWDSQLDKIKTNIKEINPEKVSDTDRFEFSASDSDGRKKEAQKLVDKVKSKISAWSNYTVWIHFIGLGQGGNVVNECSDLLAKDGQFHSEKKWCVKSVIYVSTPLYKNHHLLNKDCFKGEGGSFAFGNNYDLTQNGIQYFEPNDKLIQMIKDSNKNTLSFAVGKVKLRLIKIVSFILGGLNLSLGDQSDLNKFDLIKSEIEGMINEVIEMVKKIISDGASFVKIGDLPHFSDIANGYGSIPGECVASLQHFFEGFTKQLGNQVKSRNITLGPKDLANVLNCLCPLFNKITASLSIFKYDSKTGADLAKQIIESAGITKVFAPAEISGEDLSNFDPYHKKVKNKAAKEGEADRATVFIAQVKNLIGNAAENSSDATSLTDKQKISLAEALSCMVQPMLVSKQQVYKKLLEETDGFMKINERTKNVTTNNLMAIPGDQLSNLGIDYPEDLKTAIGKTDSEISRIKSFFDKNNFGLQEDSLYFIYNSHNLTFKEVYAPIAYCIDKQTSFIDYKKSKGFDPDYTTANSYRPASEKPKDNVMPAQELPAPAKS